MITAAGPQRGGIIRGREEGGRRGGGVGGVLGLGGAEGEVEGDEGDFDSPWVTRFALNEVTS